MLSCNSKIAYGTLFELTLFFMSSYHTIKVNKFK